MRYYTIPKYFMRETQGNNCIFRKDLILFDSIRLKNNKEGLKLTLILASHKLFKKFHFNNQNWNKTYFIAVTSLDQSFENETLFDDASNFRIS